MEYDDCGYCDECDSDLIRSVEFGSANGEVCICAACLVKALALFPNEEKEDAKT